MNRKLLWLLTVIFLASIHLAEAQQPAKVPRIGYVSGTGDASNQGPYVEALRQGLRDLGYVEGKNFVIEYRGAEGKPDRTPSLVTELVQLKVDVLVVPTALSIRAAKQATKTIPIIMVTQVDPVATGLVDSLAHPGGYHGTRHISARLDREEAGIACGDGSEARASRSHSGSRRANRDYGF
ncbi:MAG TPA: ABC transporter substrate binding protein [Pyrinomonadaceae bacterium]